MKRLLVITAALLAILPVLAQAPQGIVMWKAADLKAYASTLAPKINDQKLATQALADFGGYNTLMVYREASGEAEYHETAADFTIIEAGEGELILGGTIKGGHSTGQGEIRGTSIDGGRSYPVAPGDVINIPAKTPHQMTVRSGQKITYMVVKVTGR